MTVCDSMTVMLHLNPNSNNKKESKNEIENKKKEK